MEVIVRAGDSLWSYSQLFSIPLQLIIDSNPSISPMQLGIGEIVHIPGYAGVIYEIKSGDTFWRIAHRESVPVDQLLLLNRQEDPAHLQVGQQIIVPKRITRKVINGEKTYSSKVLNDDLSLLLKSYPFIRQREIGQTVMGKPIIELQIGHGDKRVHYNGSFHANEWITTSALMEFINDYALALTNGNLVRGMAMSPFYYEVTLSVVPMVNIDGVDLAIEGAPNMEPYRTEVIQINEGSTDFTNWKANIRGVDLNDQFPALWEKEAERQRESPSPRDYPGPHPLSEPEAKAMARLTEESNFARVLAFHTQGQVIFWGFEGFEPPESEIIVNEFARVSGYEPIRYVDSYAGYKDWFIQDWHRPGFTIELGIGENPLPISQFPEIYERAYGIMLAGLYM